MNLTEFQQKISTADKPMVVDFWATWCMPCRVTKPILEKLAGEYAGKVEFLPIDADTSRDVLEHFQIIGIPTVITFRKGTVAGRVTGALGIVLLAVGIVFVLTAVVSFCPLFAMFKLSTFKS